LFFGVIKNDDALEEEESYNESLKKINHIMKHYRELRKKCINSIGNFSVVGCECAFYSHEL